MKFRHLIEIKQPHYLTFTDSHTTCKGGGGGQNIIGKKCQSQSQSQNLFSIDP